MANTWDEWGEDQLRAAWQQALTDAGATAEKGALDALLERYREPHRHYHSVAHVTAVVATVDAMSDACHDPATTALAAFFHDAVYEIGAADNEAASADLAARSLRGWGAPGETADRIARLIEATADHTAPPDLPDAAVLLDADLAILAAHAPRYDRYVSEVRREYQAVPDELWRQGRSAVLESFLNRGRIYVTDIGSRWENTARSNLSRELTALRSAKR